MAEQEHVPAPNLLWPLVKALHQVSFLADSPGRNLVLRLVTDDLGHPLPVIEYPQATAHLLSIVTACRDSAGGLQALLNVLEQLEPGTIHMRAVRLAITRMLEDSSHSVDDMRLLPGERWNSDPDPVSGPRIWGPVPLRNPHFTGREDLLDRLRRRLVEPRTTAVLPEALYGMGGVGKSQTVVEYIYRHADEYDLIWWISAEQSAHVVSGFVALAQQIGLPAESAETAVNRVVDALRRKVPPYRRWLLVFDNAESPDEVAPFFPASGHIVVTSRNQ
jgi:hypothetical protein